MAKLTRKEAEAIVAIVLDSLHDKLYEPWEWNDMESLPNGFASWNEEGAAEAYIASLEATAVKNLLKRKG